MTAKFNPFIFGRMALPAVYNQAGGAFRATAGLHGDHDPNAGKGRGAAPAPSLDRDVARNVKISEKAPVIAMPIGPREVIDRQAVAKAAKPVVFVKLPSPAEMIVQIKKDGAFVDLSPKGLIDVTAAAWAKVFESAWLVKDAQVEIDAYVDGDTKKKGYRGKWWDNHGLNGSKAFVEVCEWVLHNPLNHGKALPPVPYTWKDKLGFTFGNEVDAKAFQAEYYKVKDAADDAKAAVVAAKAAIDAAKAKNLYGDMPELDIILSTAQTVALDTAASWTTISVTAKAAKADVEAREAGIAQQKDVLTEANKDREVAKDQLQQLADIVMYPPEGHSADVDAFASAPDSQKEQYYPEMYAAFVKGQLDFLAWVAARESNEGKKEAAKAKAKADELASWSAHALDAAAAEYAQAAAAAQAAKKAYAEHPDDPVLKAKSEKAEQAWLDAKAALDGNTNGRIGTRGGIVNTRSNSKGHIDDSRNAINEAVTLANTLADNAAKAQGIADEAYERAKTAVANASAAIAAANAATAAGDPTAPNLVAKATAAKKLAEKLQSEAATAQADADAAAVLANKGAAVVGGLSATKAQNLAALKELGQAGQIVVDAGEHIKKTNAEAGIHLTDEQTKDITANDEHAKVISPEIHLPHENDKQPEKPSLLPWVALAVAAKVLFF